MPKGTAYIAPVWVNDNEPDLSAENLNPVMAEIETLDKAVFWNTGNTYASGDVVLYAGAVYASLQDANAGHTPGATPTWWLQLASSGTTNAWDSGRTYALNSPCTKDGIPYRSLVAGNIGNDPVTAADKWEVVGGSGQGVENFLKNALTKANVTFVTATGLTSAAWSTDASAVKLLAAGALKAVVPSSGTRTLDVALSDLDAINVGLTWEVRFAYLIDTAGADGLVAVSLYDGTTDVATSLGALPYAGGNAQMILGTVIPTTTLAGQRLRFTFSGAVGFNFYLAEASVGPKTSAMAPAISRGIPYTPVTQGLGTPALSGWKYWVVGDRIRIQGKFVVGTSTADAVHIGLPPGYTTSPDLPNDANVVGVAVCSYGGALNWYMTAWPSVGYLNMGYQKDTSSAMGIAGGTVMTNGAAYTLFAEVQVAQRSVNTNLAGDFTEYASNSSSTDADDTSSFVYGSGGSVGHIGVTALTTYRRKRVRFTRPIQATDLLLVELYNPATGMWAASAIKPSTVSIMNSLGYGTTGYGGISLCQVNATDVDVGFEQRPDGSNAWNNGAISGCKWRIRKISNGNMAEVPPVVRAEYSNQIATTANAPMNFSTKVEDTHNAVTIGASWKFTAPIMGVYALSAIFLGASVPATPALYKNGVRYRLGGNCTASQFGQLNANIRLGVGDYIDVRLDSAPIANAEGRIEIVRIGS